MGRKSLKFIIFRFLHEWFLDKSNLFGRKCYGNDFRKNISKNAVWCSSVLDGDIQYSLLKKSIKDLTKEDIENMNSYTYKRRFYESGFRNLVNNMYLSQTKSINGKVYSATSGCCTLSV